MFVISANSFLLALDMFRSKCIFYSIHIFFFFALEEVFGCGSQLPAYHGWYIASPLPSQMNCYGPSIRKVHHETTEILPLGPICMVPSFVPYPYEIFHVQHIIQPNEDVQFPNNVPYEDVDHYEMPVYEPVEMEEEEEEEDEENIPHDSMGSAGIEMEDMRSTPYPDNYYYPHQVGNLHEIPMATAVAVGDETEVMNHPPRPEEPPVEEETEVEPGVWAHYVQSQAYTPHYETESTAGPGMGSYEEETGETEAPCHAEQTTTGRPEETPESTPIPQVLPEDEPIASASAMSQHQQDILSQMHEKYESEEASPCDGYFEKNAANLAKMLEQHFDRRHVKGSRSEGSEHSDTSRLFTPIIKALKNIFGSFMSTSEKPSEPQGKPTEPEPITTEGPKQETTTKPSEVQTPETPASDTQGETTPAPESGAAETPAPAAEEGAGRK